MGTCQSLLNVSVPLGVADAAATIPAGSAATAGTMPTASAASRPAASATAAIGACTRWAGGTAPGGVGADWDVEGTAPGGVGAEAEAEADVLLVPLAARGEPVVPKRDSASTGKRKRELIVSRVVEMKSEREN